MPDLTLESPPSMDASRTGDVVRQVARGIGWAVTIALLAVGFGQAILAPNEGIEVPVPLGGLEARNLEVSWIDTQHAGPVLVLRGVLSNPGPSAVTPAEALGVTLLDADGAIVPDVVAPLGSALEAEEIRSLGSADVDWLQQQAAAMLREYPLAPGESRSFQALLADPPLSAARMRVGRVALEIAEPPAPERAAEEESAG